MSSISLQSRSRQEDPEQLRLKQKAKEVRMSYNKWLYVWFLCKALWWARLKDLSLCYCLYCRCNSRSWLRSGREKPTKQRWQQSDQGKSGEWTLLLEVLVQRWGMRQTTCLYFKWFQINKISQLKSFFFLMSSLSRVQAQAPLILEAPLEQAADSLCGSASLESTSGTCWPVWRMKGGPVTLTCSIKASWNSPRINMTILIQWH